MSQGVAPPILAPSIHPSIPPLRGGGGGLSGEGRSHSPAHSLPHADALKGGPCRLWGRSGRALGGTLVRRARAGHLF